MSRILPSTFPSNLYIPPELLREIFSYCDTPTLGNVCRSSRTFLELASPFLYTHIVLDSIDSVVKLFLLETTSTSPPSFPSVPSPPSSIASVPRLVPLSRIRTFTYFSTDTTSEKDELQLPCDLPSTPPLPIDVFVFNVRGRQTIQDEQDEPQVATVLNLFNPTSFILRGSGAADEWSQSPCLHFGPLTSDADVHYYLPSWNRLTSIVLSNATTCLHLSNLALHQLWLAQNPGERTKPTSFLLCHDFLDPVRSIVDAVDGFGQEVDTLCMTRHRFPEGSSVRLVAWVGSEEEKEDLEYEAGRYVHDDSFEFGEQPGGKLEIVVEVHPSRVGRRDREDAWVGKAVESWR